ncbi:preprotein translocase subunit SecE [Candidatus Peregrinibacteria bacterium]|nr:preprotein translocase subunit SecE [Candidatus Peregrinibacteria bacterium]
MNTVIAYINGALEELRHVRWPTRQQAVRFSAVVILFSLAMGIFFGIIDFGFSELISLLLSFLS